MWGEHGSDPGQLAYPYDIVVTDEAIYVCEYGNHRIQKFDHTGRSLATWGKPGRGPGELCNPWAIVLDSHGELHVIDTYNHRVQRVRF
jgi:DNA-binding beta-propeller fold protein YncE